MTPDGETVWSLNENFGYIYSLALDHQGFIYLGDSYRTVRKVSPTGQVIWTYHGHRASVNAVAVDELGFVFSGDLDSIVKKINPDGTELKSNVFLDSRYYGIIRDIITDPRGFLYIACSSSFSLIKVAK